MTITNRFIFRVLLSLTSIVITYQNSFPSPRNVLIEYVTGTWCGNCPCGHQALDAIHSSYPQTIVIAYHAFNSDPWRNFYGSDIVNEIGFFATPSADIDRNILLANSDYGLWTSSVQNRYDSSPESKINIDVTSKSYNTSTREFNFTVNSTALENLTGQYSINFVITENNLIYQQNFYSNCGTPGYVQNYTHNHVARTMVNGSLGEYLNSNNEWGSNQTFTKKISTVLSPEWNAENCRIVVFVYKDASTLALSNVEQSIEDNVTGTTGIIGNPSLTLSKYNLSQNYPNPFNPVTNVKFSIPENANVSFKVYDLNGKEVGNYLNGFLTKGSYSIEVDGSNLASGIYFYVIKANDFTDRKKMILIK